MSVISAIAIYFLIWWIVLFAVLPFGVTTQQEAGDVVDGTTPSAPSRPFLFRKVVATSLIAAVIYILLAYIYRTGLIRYEMIPFLPDFEAILAK